MRNKYMRKEKRSIIQRMLIIPVFIAFSFIAVKVGVLAGNTISRLDSSLIVGVDTAFFKTALNNSIPVIDTIYNSGRVDTSIAGEISDLIKSVFHFDLKMPLTVLNAQSPYFNNYYNNEYQVMVAQKEQELKNLGTTEADASSDSSLNTPVEVESDDTVIPPDGSTATSRPDLALNEPTPVPQGNIFDDEASSIYYEPEDEDRNTKQNNSVSNGKIDIHNQTKFKLSENDINKLLNEELKLDFDRKSSKILIYHTHTTESYLRKLEDLNRSKSDFNNWTVDQRYNIVRVGDELTNELKKLGIEIVHNGTTHDFPSYNASYNNSLSTVKTYLKSDSKIKLSIDLHRDGLEPSDPRLRTAREINGKSAARIMFVVGSNEKFVNPEWKENLKLALKLQQKLNELYPGITKPIIISKNRYNQHLAQRGIIIEIGADGDTLDEALLSAKYLANAINEVIK